MTLKKTHIRVLIFLTLTISACKKFVSIDPPKSQITTATVFKDSSDADAAILGIYINMMQAFSLGFCSGGITAYPGLSADELYQSTTDINSEFYNNSISVTNATNMALWTSAYNYLYDVNACLDGLRSSNTITTAQKNPLIGEAECIRAFLYFNLVNLYGAVPLSLTTDYQTNRLLARVPENEIYAQIVADLNNAKSLLPKTSEENARASYYAATALLARTYLYEKKYDSAMIEATEVINSSNYELEADLNNVFTVSSKEIIWGLQPVYPGKETWEGYYFIPSSTTVTPKFVIANELYNSFEDGDKRKTDWIQVNVVNGQAYPYPYKYHENAAGTAVTERYSLIRLAELYLIRAEAEARLNNLNGAKADLNVIRHRAGLADRTTDNQDSLLNYIWDESRWELMCEWGHRWFDLKRTNRLTEILSPLKENWSENDSLYPIPQTEINNDPELTQNHGYE